MFAICCASTTSKIQFLIFFGIQANRNNGFTQVELKEVSTQNNMFAKVNFIFSTLPDKIFSLYPQQFTCLPVRQM